jgi:hypothetical protein
MEAATWTIWTGFAAIVLVPGLRPVLVTAAATGEATS